MSVDGTYEPRGQNFIPPVINDRAFRRKGFFIGVSSSGYYYVVVDPQRHPFYIWKKKGDNDYQSTAESLGAAVFSNGPMMDDPAGIPGKAYVKKQTAKGAGIGAGIGLGGGLLAAIAVANFWNPAGWVLGGIVLGGTLLGGGIGGYVGYRSALKNWRPFGKVYSTKNGINDPGANMQGLYYFGRGQSTSFNSFQVGNDPPPAGLVEYSGGLIPLIRNFVPVSSNPTSPSYHQGYASLEGAAGTVAWALVPLVQPITIIEEGPTEGVGEPGAQPPSFVVTGVIVVIGKYSSNFNQEVVGLLSSIATKDAVAMDGSNSVLLGSGSTSYVGTPVPEVKQEIQKYGLYCQ